MIKLKLSPSIVSIFLQRIIKGQRIKKLTSITFLVLPKINITLKKVSYARQKTM